MATTATGRVDREKTMGSAGAATATVENIATAIELPPAIDSLLSNPLLGQFFPV